jgi:two-component system, NtrC family, nitrogen regulation response regulator NtrX
MKRARILVVEDRDSLRRMVVHALESEGYEVLAAADGHQGVALAREQAYDLLLSDLKLPGPSGLDVLAAAKSARPGVPVVILTGYGSVPTAVEAMRAGAHHFLEKPLALDELLALVAEALIERPGRTAPPETAIIGRHPRLESALADLARVATTDSTVLLLGESGTGKELFARALHAASKRREGPFVAVNCAAIPEALVENELFGHERGAFTGADRRHAGRFEQAQGGTLFLDEVGELPLAVQGKLLRVLEERSFDRVGGGKPIRAEVRVVAATNRSLDDMVAAGTFRADLYFRLNVFPVVLPPLRERASDIPELARHLLAHLAARHQRVAPELTADAVELLLEQSWPGNVRELSNVLERALIVHSGGRISARELAGLLAPLAGAGEADRLRRALAEASGDRHAAAERLGWSYRTLLRRLQQHGL